MLKDCFGIEIKDNGKFRECIACPYEKQCIDVSHLSNEIPNIIGSSLGILISAIIFIIGIMLGAFLIIISSFIYLLGLILSMKEEKRAKTERIEVLKNEAESLKD